MSRLDEIVREEMERLRPQFSAYEWFTLRAVVEESLRRAVNAADSTRCASCGDVNKVPA